MESGRCEVVVEIGINHNGNMERARSMVALAAASGADVAKFQLYDPERLLKREWFSADDWKGILASELSFEQVRMLHDCCAAHHIEFMASAFDLERLRWLERLGVRRHKIASRSVFDRGYVEAVKATGKPLVISMGWLLDGEGYGVDERLLEDYREKRRKGWPIEGMENETLLYCISKYPTALGDLKYFPSEFGNDGKAVFQGFSDHTAGITAACVAIARGALMVEKHFTLNKALPGPDHAGSMTPDELRALCLFRDEYQEMRKS